MQKIHDDHGVHRRFRVTGALEDRRHDLEEDGKGNDEKNERRIGEREGDDVGCGAQELHREAIQQEPGRP